VNVDAPDKPPPALSIPDPKGGMGGEASVAVWP